MTPSPEALRNPPRRGSVAIAPDAGPHSESLDAFAISPQSRTRRESVAIAPEAPSRGPSGFSAVDWPSRVDSSDPFGPSNSHESSTGTESAGVSPDGSGNISDDPPPDWPLPKGPLTSFPIPAIGDGSSALPTAPPPARVRRQSKVAFAEEDTVVHLPKEKTSPALGSWFERRASITAGDGPPTKDRRRSSAIAPDEMAKWAVSRRPSAAATGFAILEGDEEENEKEGADGITELPVIPANAVMPKFDKNFGFQDGHRRRSEAELALPAEKDEDYEKFIKANGGRRRSSCVLTNRRASVYSIAEEKEVRALGKKRLKWTKRGAFVVLILVNALFITVSWKFSKYWYICKFQS